MTGVQTCALPISLDITESNEIDETVEEITLTTEEVETIVPSTASADEKTE